MGRQRWISLAVAAASVMLATPLIAGTVVSAGSATVSTGDIFTVPVSIADVSDLFAFQFDLTFDPAILQLQSISEGTFLPLAGSTIFVPGTIDNTAGTATITADTLTGSGPGASGGAELADFMFQAIAPGTSAITLSNVILLDSSLGDIPFTTSDGAVTVGTAVVPEPVGLAWVGALAIAAALRLRRAA
jgi:general secretion pathway protein D